MTFLRWRAAIRRGALSKSQAGREKPAATLARPHVLLTAVITALFLAGCSTLDLGAAKSLAGSGIAASTALYNDTTQANREFSLGTDRSALIVLLGGGMSPSAENAARRQNVARMLAARARMVQSLVIAYKSFDALVTYDAAAEMQAATTSLVESANSFITSVNTATQSTIGVIPANIGSGLGSAFGFLAEERLKREVARASVVMRTAVKGAHDALAKESQFAGAIRREALVQKSVLRAALLRQGLASYAEIVPSIVSLADVGAVSDPDGVLSSKPTLRMQLETFLETRTAREVALVQQQYDALLGALMALDNEHQKLEQGRAVNIALILEWVSRIQVIYDELTAEN